MNNTLKISLLLVILSVIFSNPLLAKSSRNIALGDSLPYRKIPDYPDDYTAETIVARMIDGLGFRYYWATEGLRKEDLKFQPSKDARTSEATIDHILGLSNVIINSFKNVANTQTGEEISTLPFEVRRKRTLENLKTVSDLLRSGTVKVKDLKIVFQRGNSKQEFPFWNQINGPISDALWHVGQVVTFRRSSGNPFNAKVSVLTGKLSE